MLYGAPQFWTDIQASYEWSSLSAPHLSAPQIWDISGRNVKQYPDAEQLDGVLIVRLDAPLYFANSRFIRDRLRRYKRKAEARAALAARLVTVPIAS